ncbi:MAG: hypothetical protein ACOCSE_05320 [Chitinivibrionales bacterium]
MVREGKEVGVVSGKDLLQRIESAERRLYSKLIRLDIEALGISEYNRRYLEERNANLKGVLQMFGRLLYLCLNRSGIPIENFVLTDYGGGSGGISFLAAEMGIGCVVYNDIYDVSCRDVSCISDALGLRLDHIVCGDVDDLVSYLQKHEIMTNAVASNDVIEHIYDVKYHVKRLSCLSENKFRVVYASDANHRNPRSLRSLKTKQIQAEYRTKERKRGHKERDTLQPFLDVRRLMISEYASDMDSETVEYLARCTRGLVRRDIERCVDEYRVHGSISYRMDHSTNTCDPYTGNWCEHIMDFDWLKKIFRDSGFSVKILTGFFHADRSLFKRMVKGLLDCVIRISGGFGIFLSPYYIVYAEYLGKEVGDQ